MAKTDPGKQIPSFPLDAKYLFVHKEGTVDSNFGLDNTPELIGDGFGLYSSARVREKIGPLKSNFYRIGFCRAGSLQVDCGLETFTHLRNTIHFNFPGQIFALKNKSEDMFSYYILFSQAFIDDILPPVNLQSEFPFFDYEGVPFLQLSEEEATTVEQLFHDIDAEIKTNAKDRSNAIKLLINLMLLYVRRSYSRQNLSAPARNHRGHNLVSRYKKLVAQHFIKTRSVNEYASKLSVSPQHLQKIIKEETGKSPGEFIDEMLMMELKALLKYSMLTVSEIAYRLEFSDPSHLTKFFKKHSGITPLEYRNS